MTRRNKLVLIGGGGHCKSVLDAALQMNIFDEIVITDCGISPGTEIMGCRVAGNDDMLPDLFARGYTNAFISIGSIKSAELRQKAYENALEIGFTFPNIIDPSAVIAKNVQLGAGVFVGKRTVVNSEVTIADMAIINTGSIIEHECYIGQFAHVAVSATLCGGVKLEEGVFIGSNATVIQGVEIGMNSIIGAGTLVLNDVSPNSTVVGIPGGYLSTS